MAQHSPVEERIGERLRDRGETIAVAESCTGGVVGSKITGVPGSSDYFVGGIISYVDRTKSRLLAIPAEILERRGPVSRPVAREMAQHVRDEAAADWGVSTTGYAGPESGDDAPVGTVYIGVASLGISERDSPFATVERHTFDGTRHEVREQVADRALASVLEQIRARS